MRFIGNALLLIAALSLAPITHAQDWPRKSLTVVAPFTAGGITDILTRIMADELGKSLGQPAVVENRAGAGGSIGLSYVLSQPADGYTLVMGGNGPSAIVPSLNPNAAYGPKNFEPIAFVAGLPSMLVVHPSVPGTTPLEFADYAKQQGPKISCASHGEGSFNHLACVQFNKITGASMTHVPYKGASAVNADLLTGRVQVYFAVLPTVLSFIKNGQLKALATGDQERVAALPNVPTLKEAGIPGIVIGSWNALYVKAGTPAPILARLRAESEKILRRPDVIARIAATDAVTKPISAERLGQMTIEEYEAYGRIAREGNIKLN
jgi:tripartite-type tricarboxylate transporter receptor subunit TctC